MIVTRGLGRGNRGALVASGLARYPYGAVGDAYAYGGLLAVTGSLQAGVFYADASVDGSTLSVPATLLYGSAQGEDGAVGHGTTLTALAGLLEGSVTAFSEVSGLTLPVGAVLLPGQGTGASVYPTLRITNLLWYEPTTFLLDADPVTFLFYRPSVSLLTDYDFQQLVFDSSPWTLLVDVYPSTVVVNYRGWDY